MRPALKFTLTGVLALTFAGIALLGPADRTEAAAPPDVKRMIASDQLDYVFFASDRPVLIRMHVRVGDKPYSAPWAAWLDKLFTWFDKDGDGFLNPTEAARLPQANALSTQLQGGIGGRGGPALSLAALDTNKDGKVSKEEFRDYYRKNGLSPLRFNNNNNQASTAKQTNDSIYKRLEVDPTAKLTQEKLARLPDLLGKLDENEDELLTAQELSIDGPTAPLYAVAPLLRDRQRRMTAVDTGLIPIPPVGLPTGVAQQLLTRYDKNKDGKLARTEIGFDRALFDRLDANHDGFLDAGELTRFFDLDPDLVFRGRVGKLGSVVAGAIRFGLSLGKKGLSPDRALVDAKGRPMAKKVRKVNSETLAFNLGDAAFDLQVNEGQTNIAFGRSRGIRQFYLQQYEALAEKKGYVDRSQEKANANGQLQYLFFLFPQADKNADGQLTRKELEAYLDLTDEGGNCFVTVQVNDHGRNLFNVLDANGDGQLSIREMRTAWQRVKPLCKDGKGLIQTDLPRSIRIQVMQGSSFNRGLTPFSFDGGTTTARTRDSGPLPMWFTKMDRNRDGDVSPKEWLGTEEEFRAIDADGDGLISGEEAKQFEARRKAGEKKPDAAKKPVAARK